MVKRATMPEYETKSPVKEITLELTVIRADGTKEDLGEVARYDRPDDRDEEVTDGDSSG